MHPRSLISDLRSPYTKALTYALPVAAAFLNNEVRYPAVSNVVVGYHRVRDEVPQTHTLLSCIP